MTKNHAHVSDLREKQFVTASTTSEEHTPFLFVSSGLGCFLSLSVQGCTLISYSHTYLKMISRSDL